VSESLFDRLKARGEEVFGQISAQLMSNPQFMKAMEHALRGKQKLDEAAGRALKQMNIPTRSEFKRALARIETLEEQLAALKEEPKSARRARGSRPKASKAEGKASSAPAKETPAAE